MKPDQIPQFKGPAHHLLNRERKIKERTEGDDQQKIRRLTPAMIGGELSAEQRAAIKARRAAVNADAAPGAHDPSVSELRAALEAASKAAAINPETATLPQLAAALAAVSKALKIG